MVHSYLVKGLSDLSHKSQLTES